MMRLPLPQRRFAETFDLAHGSVQFRVTVGYYPNRTPGEVFVSGVKSGADFEAVARDGAVLLSIAIQHGVPLAVIKGALTRNSDGSASTVIGAIVDRLEEQA